MSFETKTENPPAFPEQELARDILGGATLGTRSSGMTLRDYFAAKAMQAMIATAASPALLGLDGAERICAIAAFKMADAMLAERSRQQ